MSCDRCDNGWVWVGPGYVEAVAARRFAALEATGQTPSPRQAEAVRSAGANTVYPCKTCRPEAFTKWAERQTGRDGDPGPEPPPETWHDRY